MSNAVSTRRKSRLVPAILALGIATSLLVAFVTTGALSGFTASINNSNNTIGSGTLLMSETQGAITCTSSTAGTVSTANAGTCTTINKFGGSTTASPGEVFTSTVTITNSGTTPANTFTLTPAACTVSTNGPISGSNTAGFCSKVNITILDEVGAKCVAPVSTTPCAAPSSTTTLNSIATKPITLAVPVAPGEQRRYTFKVQLDAASATNADQGLLASMPLLWSFAS
jgi:hypothetical protein